jgi:hypothetical protein
MDENSETFKSCLEDQGKSVSVMVRFLGFNMTRYNIKVASQLESIRNYLLFEATATRFNQYGSIMHMIKKVGPSFSHDWQAIVGSL